MNFNEINKNAEVSKKLQAFSLFLEKGLKAVESMFPAYVQFVKENKEKSLREIKQQLALQDHSM